VRQAKSSWCTAFGKKFAIQFHKLFALHFDEIRQTIMLD